MPNKNFKRNQKNKKTKAWLKPQPAFQPAGETFLLHPTKSIDLVAPNGMKFSVELINPKVLDRIPNRKKARMDACEPVTNFLNQVSQVLFQSTFQSLVPSQRNIAWSCIKECKEFGNYFLEGLVSAMDSSFHRSDSDSEIFNINPSTMVLFADKIFHHSSYLIMTTSERLLLREFLIKTNGAMAQWENRTNEKLYRIIQRVQELKIWPKKSILAKTVVEIDRKLQAIYIKDVERIECVRKQQAILDYESHFDDLNIIAQVEVIEKIELEYKVRLLDAERKDPFTLDEAAYFAYLIPYNLLSPYARYCAARFRGILVEKQWLQMKTDHSLDLKNESTDLDVVAYVGFDILSLQFMFNFSMNQFMLSKWELNVISHFPVDYTRRYQRRLSLKSRIVLQEKYLNALFLDDPFNIVRRVDLNIRKVNPASPAQHIVKAFSGDTGESSTQASSSQSLWKVDFKAMQESEDDSDIADSSQIDGSSNAKHVNKEAVSQDEYMAILDEPLDEDKSVVKAEPEVQRLVEEKDDNRLFVAEPPYNADNVNAQLARLNRLTSKFGALMWFKFTLHNTIAFDRNEIIQALMSSIQHTNKSFFLYNLHENGNDSVFFSKVCLEVVDFFLRRGLMIKTSLVEERMFITIEANCDRRDLKRDFFINNIIMNFLGRQVGEHPGFVDLSDYNNKFEIASQIYYPLHHPPNLQSMLSGVNGVSSVYSLNLSNNGISRFSSKKNEISRVLGNLKHLQSLDLRGNKLILSALHGLTILSLKRVYLDGNPLCSFYENEKDYVSDITGVWRGLVAIDGCRLAHETIIAPCIHQHYLATTSAKPFLDQFLIHFFSIFDSSRRDLLGGMYHSKAMLSMSASFLDEQCTSEDACLAFYMGQNRNIKKISDLSKVNQHLHQGAREIMEFFAQFPETKHNPKSFCVDVMQFNEERVHISISGNYIEMISMKELPRFFRRVFNLVKFHDAYLIVNEMLYVNNCTTEQSLDLSVNNFDDKKEALDLYLCTSTKLAVHKDEQRLGMMKKLSDLTGMNVLWSMRCLDDMKWDLRNALIYFHNYYQKDLIPSEAFL